MLRRTAGSTATVPPPPSSKTRGQHRRGQPPKQASSALLPMILGITCLAILLIVGVVMQSNESGELKTTLGGGKSGTIPYERKSSRRRPLFKLKNLDEENNRCSESHLNRKMLDKSLGECIQSYWSIDRSRYILTND